MSFSADDFFLTDLNRLFCAYAKCKGKISSVMQVKLFNSSFDLFLINYELQNSAGVPTSVAKF